jgi:hypothetical protein
MTSRRSSGPQGKLMLMESRKQVDAEAATAEESKMRSEARADDVASYPIVLPRMSRLPTSMSGYDASSRCLAFRRFKSERALGPRLRRFALAAHAALPSLSWGWVLGTGSRFLREAQGSWRKGCVWQTKRCSCRKNAVASAGSQSPSRSANPMVRRGSTVRVRQRALGNRC